MFDGYCADVAHGIDVEQSVLVKVTCFSHWCIAELDEQGVGAGKVAIFHLGNQCPAANPTISLDMLMNGSVLSTLTGETTLAMDIIW